MIYDQKRKISYELKSKFSLENKIVDLQEKCVFCWAGANQIKKGIGIMVDAFCRIDNGNMALVLALKNVECQIGTYQFMGEYDMTDLISNPNIYVVNSALSDSAHASIFKMSDFLLYPSQGEAPGLQMAEAQLCGCIPIATNYTGLPEESCFPDLLINEFILHRGQFNCYRAIIDSSVLATYMQIGFDFWVMLNDFEQPDHEKALQRYELFMLQVQEKFKNRTWKQTASELDAVCKSLMTGNLRIDQELMKL